jgi:hypothetical protein
MAADFWSGYREEKPALADSVNHQQHRERDLF